MTSQPVEANVVLTADNSGYDQAMSGSAQTTEQLMHAVDTLSSKISKMTKVAGKSLIGISAADTATIVGTTKAWNDYEKQMERLRSQAAVLSRSTEQQNKVFKDYSASVKNLRTEYGLTTTEASKLNEVLSKVTSVKNTRDLKDLAEVFTRMSAATGESSEGLASSLTNLQQIMGKPINARTSKEYADTFTYLAAQTQSSAQGLIDFTAQIAPVGESLGMNTKQLAGFATAFTKAGQQSGSAALAFTRITSDMLHSIQSGSPEMATYANIVGTTTEAFTKLAGKNSTEAVIEVLEHLSRGTKQASIDMERLGLDSAKTRQALTAMTNAPGGIRGAMGLADDPRARGASGRGYEATLAGFNDELAKTREELKITAESFGSAFAPAAEDFLKILEKLSRGFRQLIEGPIGSFMESFTGIVAPIAAGAGALLLFAGALLKVATAFAAVRSSAAYGLREGLAGRSGITRDPATGMYVPRGGGPMGVRGQQLLEGANTSDASRISTWFQRGQYNAGIMVGQGLGAFRRGGQVPESWYGLRESLSARMPWTDQYVRPETPRSALSYVAGAAGAGVRNFITPQFDPMRFADPTKRQTWLAQEAPWLTQPQQARLLPQLARAMGQTGLAQTQMQAQRAEYARVKADPLLTDAERESRLENIREVHRETIARRNAGMQAETSVRQEIAAREPLRRALNNAEVGAKGLGAAFRDLGRNVTGGVFGREGALATGTGAFMRSRMAGPVLSMGGLAAAQAMGIQSNAVNMGLAGAAIGSMVPGAGTAVGAGIGTVAGIAMDMAKANDNASESIKNLGGVIDQVSSSGSGLTEMHTQMTQTTKDLDSWSKSIGGGDKTSFWFGAPKSPTKAAGAVKNLFEGIVGTSDVDEAKKDLAKQADKAKDAEAAMRDMARGAGVTLSGTQAAQRKQLDQFMASTGVNTLAASGIDFSDLTGTREKYGSRSRQYRDLLNALSTGGGEDLESRIGQTAAGRAMLGTDAGQRALAYQGNVPAAYQAVEDTFHSLVASGKDYVQILKSAEKTQQNIGEETRQEYKIQMGVAQMATQALSVQAPQIGRAATFQQQMRIGQMWEGITPVTAEEADQKAAAKQATQQAILDQDAYFRQMILAQESYERSRQRAQDDYSMQRSYQEQDYQIQRQRAEENFNRMRTRAIADYHRSVGRAWDDFNLQRQRQEDDYNHQLEVQAKQRAMSMNLYQRVETQRTASGTYLSANAGDIIRRMRTQVADLAKLRAMGISNDAIQMYQLASPENQQELARLVTEMTPQLTRQFNRNATTLTRLSGRLGRDEGNLDAQEQARSFQLSRDRGMQDMRRNMDRNRADFFRGLRQQKDDFGIMMDQQAEDNQRMMNRQEHQYHLTMNRAAEDMAHMGDEVLGSITEVATTAATELTGSAQKQAQLAVKSFRDLRRDTRPEAEGLKKDLADILGLPYTPTKLGAINAGGRTGGTADDRRSSTADQGLYVSPTAGGGAVHVNPSTGSTYAGGGTVPGYTPGRDTHVILVGGGEGILRPEAVRGMGGAKAIDAINHAARHGAFAAGGVFWPVPGHETGTYPGHDGVDINRGSGSDDLGDPIRAFRSGTIVYVGSGHGYGDAIFEKTKAGTVVYGHTSAQMVHAGQRVQGGQLIGQVGSTGNSSAPHLHFGIPGGTFSQAMALLAGAIVGGAGFDIAGDVPAADPRAIAEMVLKKRYPRAERTAAGMTGVHPLQPGDISHLINRAARHSIRRQIRHGAGLTMAGATSIGNEPSEHLSNEQIVHTGANRMGWGDQWSSLRALIMGESGFNNTAQNPDTTAYGMFQFLDGTWAGYGVKKTSDPWKQTQAGMRYIKARYGDPNNAYRTWESRSPHWYGDGSVFTQANVIGVGERGPEAVIPLNDQGGEFLARSIGLTTMAGGRNVSIHNYRIDRSTNFTGPITVQANDPAQMLAKLQARQRVRALSRPSLTGSAA